MEKHLNEDQTQISHHHKRCRIWCLVSQFWNKL